MNEYNHRILHEVEQSNGSTELWIGCPGGFNSGSGSDFSSLGTFIGQNTHLTKLTLDSLGMDSLDVANSLFYDGLKQNSSIHELTIYCRNLAIVGGVGQKILDAYEENNNLTLLRIDDADLQNGGENVIVTTLRSNTNLKHIYLNRCNITDEQLLPMVDAIKGHNLLEMLDLCGNVIGNTGCEALAGLLEDPHSNLQTLYLSSNRIGEDGTTTLANSLANNTKLRELWLYNNPFGQSLREVLCKVLCNKTSINSIYSSNHTLETLGLPRRRDELGSLLKLNKGTNKSYVSIKKILKYHPRDIDMEPLFEWNMEGDGERDLKALPYVVAWFERVDEAVVDDVDISWDAETLSYEVAKRKLSAMYQFAQAMPLLFVPDLHAKGGDNKIGGSSRGVEVTK